MRKRTIAVTLTAASALFAGVLAAPPGAQAAPARHAPKAIPHTKPAWIAHAQHLGRAGNTAKVEARVYLAPRGGLAALEQAAVAVSTLGSADYRQFLSVAQFRARYGPTRSEVASVEAWLRSAGLHVGGVESHNRYVSVSGTVEAAEKAFGTELNRYRHDGQAVQAPASEVKVPSVVAGDVLTVTGLDTSVQMAKPVSRQDFAPPAGFRNARPCSAYFGQLKAKTQADYSTPLPKYNGKYLTYAPCGYTGSQFRGAYEGSTDLDGSGITVAITDAYAAPTLAKDAKKYARNHGDAPYARGQLTQIKNRPYTNVSLCGGNGWYGEQALDVEAVHAMAPGAKIRYYGAASCMDSDLLYSLSQVVDQNKAQLVTNSWSDVESDETGANIAAYEQVFLQGAMQGISFMFSSGDSGDELANTGIKQVDYPASDPYATAIGGTSAAIGQDNTMKFQAGWGTDKYSLSANGDGWVDGGFVYGAGGGTSALFNQPSYQAGIAPGPYRMVPDVAMDADPTTGMLIGLTQAFPTGNAYSEYRIGGTSLASPLFAGMTALALQQAGNSVGLLNPVIYANANSGAFTDVKGAPKQAGAVRVDFTNSLDASGGLTYTVRTFGTDSTLKVRKGWDDVTGVGTPDGGWLTAIPSAAG